jgi:hypothetical protein
MIAECLGIILLHMKDVGMSVLIFAAACSGSKALTSLALSELAFCSVYGWLKSREKLD